MLSNHPEMLFEFTSLRLILKTLSIKLRIDFRSQGTKTIKYSIDDASIIESMMLHVWFAA